MTRATEDPRSTVPSPELGEAPLPDDRAYAGRARARRRWAVRTLLTLLLATVVLCVFFAWRRDRTLMSNRLEKLAPAVAALQEEIDERGKLPPDLRDFKSLRYFRDARFYAMNTERPVILASGPEGRLVIHPRGHAVIVLQDGKVTAEWMSHAELMEALRIQNLNIEAFEERIRSQPPDLP